MAEVGKDIQKAKKLLEQGELVAIPTETVYGLAGNALDINAVTKIFKVKDRPYFDPLIVHVADLNSAHNLVEAIPAKAEELANKFWPGPLTILLKRKNIIPDLVTAGLETVGIRCPDHSLTNELLRSLDFPLAAPSANPFGYVSPTHPDHVNEQLGDKIKYILDGGECKVGIESTIVGFENNEPIIYRLGGLSVEQIESVIGKATVQLNASSNPQAPGQLKSHYAPRKKLILESLSTSIKKYQSSKVGVLCFQEKVIGIDPKNQRILSPTGSLEIAAQHLFSALRELDKLDIEIILAEEVPDEGIGRAINDRLRRAASSS
jgi:L-threonylcarbamoyladenylate synthase